RGPWAEAEELDLTPGSLSATVRARVRDAIDHHRDDPQRLRIMIEEAPVSEDLIEAIGRHGRPREGHIPALPTPHPAARARALDVAAELVVGTIEMNTHKLMAAPEPIEVERLETELVAMLTRYLSGDQ